MFAEFSILTTELLEDDLYVKNLEVMTHPAIFGIIFLAIIPIFISYREYSKTKNKKNILYIIVFIIYVVSLIIGLAFVNHLQYKEYNNAYNKGAHFYERVDIKENYPETWENNKKEIYHKALEQFKDNPDDFNLETACKEHENDDKKPAACGGDLNTPLETTINGENTHILVVPSVDGKNGKLIVSFDYIFYY